MRAKLRAAGVSRPCLGHRRRGGDRAALEPGAWSLEQEVPLIQQFVAAGCEAVVGLMPLPDTPWTRGKCAYKLIQCMACAIPVVASRVGANVEAVPLECGLLAE